MKVEEATRRLIYVDRTRRRVRLYERDRDEVRFEEVGRYRCAVGSVGYETPRGVYVVHVKVKDPDWRVPNSPWAIEAGLDPGAIVKGGTDANPLKARWIGVTEADVGIGIHGTGSVESIGQAASHGCIRLTETDVIALYERTPIGCPVVIF